MIKTEILALTEAYWELQNESRKRFEPGVDVIPVASQQMGSDDLSELVKTCLDMRFAGGTKTALFEKALSPHFGKHPSALLVNSGSSANLLAISALGLRPGDEVITVAAGFPTTVNPIIQCGATPVFVDVELDTLNALPTSIMAAQSEKTKAVVLAHTLGNPFRADIIAGWCHSEGIALVEDCCDAFGASVLNFPVGSFGHYATTSFYPAHHISMGEGGAVMAATGRLRRVIESLRDWGRDCWCDPGKDNTCGKRFSHQMGDLPCGYDHKYTYTHVGYNLKATEMQASLGLTQIKKVEAFITARRQNWKALRSGIAASPKLKACLIPVDPTPGTEPSWFGFPMLCTPGKDRNRTVDRLEERKVRTRLVFAGNLTKQPMYSGAKFRVHGKLPNTDEIMNQAFWIGVHPGLTDRHISYMLEALEFAVS